MRQLRDLTGKKYAKLTVVKYRHKTDRNEHYWICRCDCGKYCIVKSGHIVSGHTQSCGCAKATAQCRHMSREKIRAKIRQHKREITRLEAILGKPNP